MLAQLTAALGVSGDVLADDDPARARLVTASIPAQVDTTRLRISSVAYNL